MTREAQSSTVPRADTVTASAMPPKAMRKGQRSRAVLVARVAFLLILCVLWQVTALGVGANILPTPAQTFEAAQRLVATGRLGSALSDSLSVYMSGYALAAATGVFVGVIMGAWRLLGKTLELYAFALAATPRIAFIPMIIVVLGLGFEAKVFIVFLGAVMPVLINTYAGVQAADEELVEMARATGAGQLRIFTQIVLPGALPYVVAGLRLGATIGLINTVVAELYTAVSGLGGLLALYGNTFRMAEYFVVVLTLAGIGVIVTETLRRLEARVSRWRLRG